MQKKIKVMIVDDSLPFRSILSSALQGHPQIEVISTAYNGSMCLNRIKENKPDVITLDFEMPDMNGLETLKAIREKYPEIGVIMLSALTTESASITMQAINAGADDFLLKSHEGKTREENIEIIKKDLAEKIIRCYEKKNNTFSYVKMMGDDTKEEGKSDDLTRMFSQSPGVGLEKKYEALNLEKKPVSMIAINFMQSHIGSLIEELKKLNMKKGVPVVIYIKMPESFLKSFIENLKPKVNMSLKILDNGDILLPRILYFVNGINRTFSLYQDEKIKVKIEESKENLSPNDFFKAFSNLRNIRLGAFLIAENIFTPGILGLKELKEKKHATFLLYTRALKEEDIALIENSYSKVTNAVILPSQMAEVINRMTKIS